MNADSSLPYGDDFFDAVAESTVSSAAVIVPLLRALVPCQSVVDIGCGRGAWLRTFREQGATTTIGYDGDYVDRSQLLIPADSFHPVDLSDPLDVAGTFDLAVCLEVAEHLPTANARHLVETLCAAAPAVLFSAALPGQGGTHHVNEQWPDYWHGLFAAKGYQVLDSLRHAVVRDPKVAWWYKQNLYLYVERGMVANNPRLSEESRLTSLFEMQIVRRQRLAPLRSVRGLAGELRRAAWSSVRTRLFRHRSHQ